MEGPVPVINAGGKKLRQHVVCVAGHNEPPDRKPHALCVIPCQHVSEVSGRHAEVDPFPLGDRALPAQRLVGFKIINDLRHQPSDIDGIGAGKEDALLGKDLSCTGGENLLYPGLGIVEIAPDAADRHIFSLLGDHLQPLDVADLALGVKYGDSDILHILKAVESSLARIAAGGCDDHGPSAGPPESL